MPPVPSSWLGFFFVSEVRFCCVALASLKQDLPALPWSAGIKGVRIHTRPFIIFQWDFQYLVLSGLKLAVIFLPLSPSICGCSIYTTPVALDNSDNSCML